MTELGAAAMGLLAALAEPFTAADSRTAWPALLVAGGVASAWTWRRDGRFSLGAALGASGWRTASAALDAQLLTVRQLLRVLGVLRWGSAAALGVAVVGGLDAVFGRPEAPQGPAWVVTLAYTAAVFVVGDLSRYLVHRAMHRIPALWEIHKVHHSAEVLTPLSFHRVHPIETLLLELRGTLVTGLLGGVAFYLWRGAATTLTIAGVEAVGFALNLAVGNLRHSHVWLPFPRVVERYLLSPAQHQTHHGAAPAEHFRNLGTWLACWDRLAGTWRASGEAPPARFGLTKGEANHRQDLASALIDPLVSAIRRSWGGGLPAPRNAPRSVGSAAIFGALAVLLPARALAEDTNDASSEAPPAPAAPVPAEPVGEEIVVSAGPGRPAIAGAAHEVTEETLERYAFDDVQRVLQRVPGVYVRGEDGFGLRPNIGMRGASSDRSAKVTLLEDGVPLSPAPYAAPAAYYFPITTRLVGIEVFKGPSAIAHGPQTVGGAVNVLTRAIPDGADGAVDASYGSFGTARVHAWGGTSGAAGGLLVEGAHVSSDGFKHLDGGGPTGFERQDLMVKGRAPLAPGHDLELKLGYGRERSDETYLGLSLEDFAADPYRRYAASQLDRMEWEHTQASLGWSAVTDGRLSVRTVAYYSSLDRSWRKLNGFDGGPDLHDLLVAPQSGQAAAYTAVLRGEEDSVTSDQRLLVGTNARRFHSYGLQSTARGWIGGERVSHVPEVGVRLHADDVRRVHDQAPFDMRGGSLVASGDPLEVTLDSATSARALAAYARDTVRAGIVSVVPGVRVEHVVTASGTGETGPIDPQARTIGLPGLSVAADPVPWLSTFAGVHRGFSPVAPGASPDARPETAWNAEAGVRAMPGAAYAELVGFGSRYSNLLGTCSLSAGCTDELDAQFNGGEVLVAGAEALVSHGVELPRGLRLTGNATYTYTWSVFQQGFASDYPIWGRVEAGDRLPYVPEHQGAFELVLAGARASVAVSGTHRGAMRDVAGQGAIPDAERIPSATVLDVSGDVRLDDRLRAYVVARNATNAVTMESLRPFGARPGAPLTVMVGLEMAAAP